MTQISRTKPVPPLVQQLQRRGRLLNLILDKLDVNYLHALTGLPHASLSRKLLSKPRLRARYLKRLTEIFDLPHTVVLPKPIEGFLLESKQTLDDLHGAVGLVFNLRLLPQMMMKSDFQALHQIFGEKAVSTAFLERRIAPQRGEFEEEIPIEDLDPAPMFEDGVRCIRAWAFQHAGALSAWVELVLPPNNATGEELDPDLDAYYKTYGPMIVDRVYSTLKQMNAPKTPRRMAPPPALNAEHLPEPDEFLPSAGAA